LPSPDEVDHRASVLRLADPGIGWHVLLVKAVALNRNCLGVQAVRDHFVSHGLCALKRKTLIVTFRSDSIGVPRNPGVREAIRLGDLNNLGDGCLCSNREIRFVEIVKYGK